MDDLESAREYARDIARQITSGETEPYRGARAIWMRLAGVQGGYEDLDLVAFVGLASEWEDSPEHRAEYEQDILLAAWRLVGASS